MTFVIKIINPIELRGKFSIEIRMMDVKRRNFMDFLLLFDLHGEIIIIILISERLLSKKCIFWLLLLMMMTFRGDFRCPCKIYSIFDGIALILIDIQKILVLWFEI